MIWNEQRAAAPAAGLAARVRDDLAAAGIEGPAAGEISRVVLAFVRERHANEPLALDYLRLLALRSLWAVGEERAVRRWAGERGPAGPVLAAAALASDMSLAHWRVLLGTRVLRAAASLARGSLWILDARRLAETAAGGGLELLFWRQLNAVLDRLVGAWDASRGQGVLGLRRLREAAAGLLACPRRARRSAELAGAIRSHCRLRLQAAGRARGWRTAPEVLTLDLDA